MGASTSISMVAEEIVNVVSGINRGETVAASALISDVLQKKGGGGAAPNMIPIGIHSMRNNTVANVGVMSGWYRMTLRAALMLSL
jgi:hypothetical protein